MPSSHGLLSAGETIRLNEPTPPGSICKDIDRSNSEPYIKLKWYVKVWKRDKLMIFIIVGVLLGFLVGLTCNKSIQNLEEPKKSTLLTFLGFPGEILMRMLKMLILPLIVSSLIVGLADLDQKASGKIGRRAIIYYMVTTLIAVFLGITLVALIKPGIGVASSSAKSNKDVRALDSFLDLIRNCFPENLVQATFQQFQTNVKVIKVDLKRHEVNFSAPKNLTDYLRKTYEFKTSEVNGTNITYYETWRDIKIAGSGNFSPGTNILGLVVFSIAVGIVLGNMETRAEAFVSWMATLNDVIMQLVTVVMWYSPVGICSLVAVKFSEMNNISGTFESLGMYMATVIVGLVIHSFFILPTIYLMVTRENPLTFVKGVLQALITAFGTSSSSATLPVTFKCLEENNKIDKRITRFVLPVGATVNMDGTALYEAVAAIFIAQAAGLELSIGQYIAVSVTATLASIGAAGIPQAGLVTMMVVLQTLGLPEDSVTLIFAVDWFLDRLRTTVNVLGDAFGAGIVAHLSRADLSESTEATYQSDRSVAV
ncbi:excitatory amino acid transporter 1 [Hydra vulgaris]|uniref:excitatory amino acid transporter 1 n=1 Tax=Hydra vulgaris TaxID=6087 RepID=UPI0002B4CDA5|nr:excitatory amino acid transporter 1 [Hydra vulgaris]XP_047140002.1 excitatory amino acid transporter 1 [Hydra vulgaris]